MKTTSYGWIIVAAGIVVTCVGFGAMLSLSIFLQPISVAMAWSRTGVSTVALLNFLALGVGSGAQLLQPLAIAVIGGVTVSMILSLLITPVLFCLLREHGL